MPHKPSDASSDPQHLGEVLDMVVSKPRWASYPGAQHGRTKRDLALKQGVKYELISRIFLCHSIHALAFHIHKLDTNTPTK